MHRTTANATRVQRDRSLAVPGSTLEAGLHERVSVINELLQAHAKALEFVVSVESRKIFVRLVDLERGEIIREYMIGSSPRAADTVNGYFPGLLLSATA